MNRKAALFISVILLTQVASYSFNEITPQIDWEEPLQGDSSWETSGRNSTTGCGSNYTQTSISTHTNSTTYLFGDDPELVFTIGCAIVGTNYTLSYKVWGWNTGTGASDWLGGLVNTSFVATNTNFSLYVPISNLGVDNYSVNTTLYNTTYDPSNTIGDYSGGWTWDANFSVTDCGSVATAASITALYTPSNPVDGDDIIFTLGAHCPMLNHDNTISWAGSDVAMPNSFHTWNASGNTETHDVYWNNSIAGTYTLFYELRYAHASGATILDSGNITINIGSNVTPFEVITTWSNSTAFYSNQGIDLAWNASALNSSLSYNVTVDVYGHNMTTNTTSIVYHNYSYFTGYSSKDGMFYIFPNTLQNGCYLVSFNLLDWNEVVADWDTWEFKVGNVNCSTTGNNSSGNNTGPMESLDAWTDSSNYSSSDDIDLKWNATDLVWDMSINYNVTVDVYGHDMATNTTSIVWSDSSVFSSTTEWFHDGFTINAGTLSTGCYYASFDLHDDDDGMFFDNVGFDFGVNTDCDSTGGNNTGNNTGGNNNPEISSVYSNMNNYSSSDEIDLHWIARDLDSFKGSNPGYTPLYNVTVNVRGVNPNTQGYTTSVLWENFTTFTAGSANFSSGIFYVPANHLSTDCYYASFELYEDPNASIGVDSIKWDSWKGFFFGVNAQCSEFGWGNGTGGNNTGNNTGTMEWLEAWTASEEYDSSTDVLLNWSANDLVLNESINYIVTLDVLTEAGSIVWWNDTIFSPSSDMESGFFTIPATTLADGCYYAKLELHDWDDGMYFDNDYLEFSIGVEIDNCDFTGGNNTGGNNSNDCPENFIDFDAGTSQNTYDLANYPEVELNFVVSCADSGTLYSVHYNIMEALYGTIVFDEMENWTGTGDMEYFFYNWLLASDLGVGNYYLNATLYEVDCWGCPGLDTYIAAVGELFMVIDTSDPEYVAYNADSDDCVQSGDDFEAKILVYAGPNEPHTVNWTIVDENGAPTSWHTQDMTTGNGGSANFTWFLDTTNLSDGIYSFQIESATTGLDMISFYFQVGCTGCGYDSSLTELNYQIWSDTFGTIFSSWNESENGSMTSSSSNSVNDDVPQIIAGTNIGWWGQISCLEFEQDYLFNYTVTNSANLIVMGDEEYFNSGPSTWYWFDDSNISTTLLPADEYCITVTLYVSPYGGSDVIYTFTECVEIVPIEDWDGCGSNLTYLEHMQKVRGNPFVQQEVVFLTTSWISVDSFVDCLVIGENYTMHTEVTTGGSLFGETTTNFTVSQFSDITQWGWLDINFMSGNNNYEVPVGNYCVETTIHSTDATFTQQIALVSTVTDCFAVVNATIDDWWDNQDNGTGNGSGTPNDPVLPDTDCDDLNGTLTGLNLTNSWNQSDCENGTGFWFNLTVNGTGITWYDPIYAVGYDYEVISGPKFASVVVPPGYGDDKYDLYLWDGTEYVQVGSDLDALTEYWFTDEGGISNTPGIFDGISKFSVRGLEISAKIDPEDPDAFVTGLSFVQDPNEIGEVILSMTPITVSDEDDDGIIDEEDNCVNDANADQADSDEDGVGDACEENQGTGDVDDDDSDSDSDSSMTTIFAMLAVGLVFVVIFFKGGGDDDEGPETGKKYYPFDNSNN
jgi:hypothetical protein